MFSNTQIISIHIWTRYTYTKPYAKSVLEIYASDPDTRSGHVIYVWHLSVDLSLSLSLSLSLYYVCVMCTKDPCVCVCVCVCVYVCDIPINEQGLRMKHMHECKQCTKASKKLGHQAFVNINARWIIKVHNLFCYIVRPWTLDGGKLNLKTHICW